MISLCVPTRGRAVRFKQMAESALATATGEIEIVARIDADDSQQYPQDLGVIYIKGPRPKHMSSLWNEAFLASSGEIVMLAADDIVFETPGWDNRVSEAFMSVPDRLLMVYADDGSFRKAPCLPFVSREWADLVGFTDPELPGWFADEAIWALAAEIRRAVFLDDVMILHNQHLGSDKTYKDAAAARQKLGGLDGMRREFYSSAKVAARDVLVEKLRAAKDSGLDRVPDPVPLWFTKSLELAARRRPAAQNTLIVIHCWSGDAQIVRDFLPYHLRHGRPILILSPENAPVEIEDDGVTSHALGLRGYFGQESLDRQRLHLEYMLTLPYDYFLLNDADSICLSPELPGYLFLPENKMIVWSNEVIEHRPHKSPYPKIAMQPPYFLHRDAIERLLSVNVKTHPITPFIDWYMIALVSESGLQHRSFPDGASFPAWRRNAIAETKQLGHDFQHVYDPRGRVQGDQLMLHEVQRGKVFIHSVKHKQVMDSLIAANEKRAETMLPVTETKTVSFLVPFREDSQGGRTQLWDFIRAYIERELPNVEIVVGTDEEVPFNKARAINRAATEATTDVFVIFDSDTWVDPADINQAVKLVKEGAAWVRPWLQKTSLSESQTKVVLAKGERWGGAIPKGSRYENRTDWWAAPPIVLSRAAFEKVNGMDERFHGWGQEDGAFGLALQGLVGDRVEIGTRDAVHLWHPRIGVHGHDAWEGSGLDQNTEYGLVYQTASSRQLAEIVRGNRGEKSGVTSSSTISVLVPFRPEQDDDIRQRIWDWLYERWKWILPEAEIVVGVDTGMPFSKTTAVNEAFSRSSGEVLIVADADTWTDAARLDRAIATASKNSRLVVPWGDGFRITQEDSERILALDPTSVLPLDIKRGDPSPDPLTAGMLFVISRSAFQLVHGMDPRFRGWGHEDISFRRACDVLLGKTMYLRMGVAYALWHPRPTITKRGRVWEGDDVGRMNSDLGNLYSYCEKKHPREMLALCEQHRLGEEPLPIPDQLGKVVPKRTGTTVHERIYG